MLWLGTVAQLKLLPQYIIFHQYCAHLTALSVFICAYVSVSVFDAYLYMSVSVMSCVIAMSYICTYVSRIAVSVLSHLRTPVSVGHFTQHCPVSNEFQSKTTVHLNGHE